jgi:hypothetical protein
MNPSARELTANMTPEERALLREWSAPCSHIVEFGCGGSTLLFLEATSAVIDSVDNNRNWVERLSAEPRPAEALRSGRLKICLVDTGPVGRWGSPTDEGTKPLWRNYSSAVWDGLRSPAVDLVFVDGRFRIACTARALLQPEPPTIAFHDFWTRIDRYADVLRFTGHLHSATRQRPERTGADAAAASRGSAVGKALEFSQFRLLDEAYSHAKTGGFTKNGENGRNGPTG